MTKNLENIFLRLDCFGPDARVKPSSVETHAEFTPDSLKKRAQTTGGALVGAETPIRQAKQQQQHTNTKCFAGGLWKPVASLDSTTEPRTPNVQYKKPPDVKVTEQAWKHKRKRKSGVSPPLHPVIYNAIRGRGANRKTSKQTPYKNVWQDCRLMEKAKKIKGRKIGENFHLFTVSAPMQSKKACLTLQTPKED